MKLEDYLKEKLNVSAEEAKRIAEAFMEYKKTYGHAHHHEHGRGENKDIFQVISETKEECVANNYDLDKIHCNGCPNNCALSNPKCGRGKMIKENVTKYK